MFSPFLGGSSPCVGVRSPWHDRSAGSVVSLGTSGTLQLGHPKDGEAALLPPVAEHVGMYIKKVSKDMEMNVLLRKEMHFHSLKKRKEGIS